MTHDLSPIDRDNDRVSVSLDEVKRVISLWKKNEGPSRDMNPYVPCFNISAPWSLARWIGPNPFP